MIVVVVGTGTDVGKTWVARALISHLALLGKRVSPWKPIASGVSTDSGDHLTLAQALGAAPEPPLYAFAEPISPHLCARRAGVAMEIAAIAARARSLATQAEIVVLETAGGLFSPLSDSTCNLDLCLALPEAKTLLVAPDRLGVLHDLTATLLAARARGFAPTAVVLSEASRDLSTGSNAEELARVTSTHVAAIFTHASDDQRPARDAWRALTA